MKQMKAMEAELMFEHPEGRDRAVSALVKQGFEVELLDDRVDKYEGVLLSPAVWLRVTGAADDEDKFAAAMERVAEKFGGEVLEVGPLGVFTPQVRPQAQ